MNYKALTLGAVLGLAAALVPSCGGKTCGPSNCQGCCDASNNCVMTQTAAACGTAGLVCVDCTKKPATPTCNTGTGQCTSGSAGGGNAGGGSAGGGSAGGGAGGGGAATGGGAGGGSATCTGCCTGNGPGAGGCAQGTCVGGTQSNNCGSNGVACVNCTTMTPAQVCGGPTGAKACMSGAGGGGATDGGQIGSECTTNADCNHESGTTPAGVTSGTGSFCKKTQLLGGATYPGGYCTKRCLDDTTCGSQGFCSWYYGLGTTGEADNYCIAKCDANGMCRPGYNCLDFSGGSGTPLLGCLLAGSDGGQFDPYDAGPSGAPGVQGNGCTGDNDCRPPDTGGCIPEVDDGGSMTGFPGGECSADCTMHPTNAFCGTGAICAPTALDLQDGLGYFVDWQCQGKCWELADGGQGLYDGGTPQFSCRSGYHCREVFTDHSGGCESNCDNPGNPGCNTAGGFSCDPNTHACM
ncbi:MAG: hypothetical protein QM723_20595 [Myxococcaceae bacterium]